MSRSLAMLIGCVVCAAAVAQTPAPTEGVLSAAQAQKAKQETVQSTTQTQVKQKSGGGYHGAKPAAEARPLTNEERQQVMSGVAKSAKDQYRPITVPPPPTVDKEAGTAARPSMSSPDVQDAIQRNQR
jgi:hypothetical protein